MTKFRDRTDYFQNIFWQVEHSIYPDGKLVTTDVRQLRAGDTLNIYQHLYPVTSKEQLVGWLRNYIGGSQLDLAAERIARELSNSLYVLNVHVRSDQSTAPFSANEYLCDGDVMMGENPFDVIDTPKMCLSFHDDVDLVEEMVQGQGYDKKLYIVLLRDDDNNVPWTEEKAQALRTAGFPEASIQSLSEERISAYWLIATVSQPASITDGERGIPDDGHGLAKGTM